MNFIKFWLKYCLVSIAIVGGAITIGHIVYLVCKFPLVGLPILFFVVLPVILYWILKPRPMGKKHVFDRNGNIIF